MNAKKTEKIRNISKILHIFANIGGVILIAGIGVIVFFIINPPPEFYLNLNFPDGTVKQPLGITLGQFRFLLSITAFVCGYMSVMYFAAGSIFRQISRDNTPFSMERVKNLKFIAILAIAFNVAFAAVLYCLALIFEYGVELQQQSDETL
ncbi:MAG: hypothetical protein FWH08_04850 [Oscillospiraceae bacterium]|nr:hypothetical protein [Oscillospiraceae bacterium]